MRERGEGNREKEREVKRERDRGAEREGTRKREKRRAREGEREGEREGQKERGGNGGRWREEGRERDGERDGLCLLSSLHIFCCNVLVVILLRCLHPDSRSKTLPDRIMYQSLVCFLVSCSFLYFSATAVVPSPFRCILLCARAWTLPCSDP